MVTYTSDITDTSYAMCYPNRMNGRQVIYGGYPYYRTYKTYAFANTTVSSADWHDMAQNGLVGVSDSPSFMLGQDFGSGVTKLIRKIRYQWIYNISKIDVRASNNEYPFSHYVTILSNEDVAQEDTDYNEILLPVTNNYRYWFIVLKSFGSYGAYTAPCVGELEMMEAEVLPQSQAYIL